VILNDFLRFDVDLVVASAFLRDVGARLPAGFELSSRSKSPHGPTIAS